MRFAYSTTGPAEGGMHGMPRVPLVLRNGNETVEVAGLVDSGAAVNVLPYHIGIRLGALWDDRVTNIQLTGNLGNEPAIPLVALAEIKGLPPVKLGFAWVKTDKCPVILGQMNFFKEFDISFYDSRLEFEVRRLSSV
jgi:hypothetical protein